MIKKLVLLTQYFPPEIGAPQNRLYEAAKGLQNSGWNVSVITALPNYPSGKIFKDYRGKIFEKEQMEGMEVQRYWLYPSNSRKTMPRVISMLSFTFTSFFASFRLLLSRPDIIIVESPPLTLAFTAWLLSKVVGAKLVMNVSDLWPLSAYELGSISKGTVYKLLERLEKFLYDHSDACTGQSQQIIDHIIKISPVTTHLFRNGVDTSRFIDKSVERVGVSYKIVYAGLLGVAQGILDVCKSIDFKKYDFEFHIYGDGAEKKELEQFLKQNPDRSIIYHGAVNRSEIPSVLQQNDIALVPLVKPIFGAVPSKIYEAMAAGLPIIFMGGGEGEILIKENKAGWICAPSDFKGLEYILSEIQKFSRQELVEKKIHCRRVAKEAFDRKKQIQQLDKFLNKLVNEAN